mmetsp:Transcript_70339/g.121866  ORF Transcript_70339/g.121866 Transcript_70339/m.121866 type:complete len:174 (-) Transcript_70339:739-1260(-)
MTLQLPLHILSPREGCSLQNQNKLKDTEQVLKLLVPKTAFLGEKMSPNMQCFLERLCKTSTAKSFKRAGLPHSTSIEFTNSMEMAGNRCCNMRSVSRVRYLKKRKTAKRVNHYLCGLVLLCFVLSATTPKLTLQRLLSQAADGATLVHEFRLDNSLHSPEMLNEIERRGESTL